jgi:hypothetical protein
MVHRYTPYNNHIRNFVVESESDITGGLQEPTYVSFHILFDFHTSGTDDILTESAIRNGYDSTNDLMVDGLLLHKGVPYSAEKVLENHANHLQYLRDFKDLLNLLQREAPWEFQDVENLQSLWIENHHSQDNFDPTRHYGKEIIIECLEDRGWKMHMLADLYRNLSFDSRWQTQLLNINSRRFSCKIIIHELREFNSISSSISKSVSKTGSPFNNPDYGKVSAFNKNKIFNNSQSAGSSVTPSVSLNSDSNIVFTGSRLDEDSDTKSAINLESDIMANPFGSASGNTFMNTVLSSVANQAASAVSATAQNALVNVGAAASQRIAASIQNPVLKNISEKAVGLAQTGLSGLIDSKLNPNNAGNIFGEITKGLGSTALNNAFGGQRNGGVSLVEETSINGDGTVIINNRNNGQSVINQLLVFELKNCEFIFDDLDLATSISVKSDKVKQQKKFKFKIRIGRVHQTSLYGVYGINTQDVHKLKDDGSEILVTDPVKSYPIYDGPEGGRFSLMHEKIFPENQTLILDRSTKQDRKNLDSNFLISAAEGLVMEAASSLATVLISKPLSKISDSLLDLDIGITKEQVVIAELDHKLEEAEPDISPISNSKNISSEKENLVDLAHKLSHEYVEIDLSHELTHEIGTTDLNHTLTHEYTDVDLSHELSHEYTDVDLDHELSHEIGTTDLDHTLTHEYTDVDLSHELSHEIGTVDLDHTLTHEYTDVDLSHELSHEIGTVDLDHTLTHEYTDVDLSHELSHEYTDVDLDHELSHEIGTTDLDHTLTHEYTDVDLSHELTHEIGTIDLDHSLSHEYTDVDLSHSLSHEIGTVDLDHSLSHEYTDVDLSHSLLHEIGTVDLDGIITGPGLNRIDLKSEPILRNDITDNQPSLDNLLDIPEVNSDLKLDGDLNGLLQSELPSIKLDHTLSSELNKIGLEHTLSVEESEKVDLKNSLNFDGTQKVDLDLVLNIPTLNRDLKNSDLVLPELEKLNMTNSNLVPELEKVKMENTLIFEGIENTSIKNSELDKPNKDSVKLNNDNLIPELVKTNLNNSLDSENNTQSTNLDNSISSEGLNKNSLENNLLMSEISSINFEQDILPTPLSNSDNLEKDNFLESINTNMSTSLSNILNIESPDVVSLQGNLMGTLNNSPSLESNTIISRPEKIELQGNLQKAQFSNIDIKNSTDKPSIETPNLSNSLNTNVINSTGLENSLISESIGKTSYEAKLEMLKNRIELTDRNSNLSRSELNTNNSLDNSIEPLFNPSSLSKPSEPAITATDYKQPYSILDKIQK